MQNREVAAGKVSGRKVNRNILETAAKQQKHNDIDIPVALKLFVPWDA